MANYLSFHAGVEGKVRKADIKGIAGHTFRKTEKRYSNHGNKDIDTALTKYNIDWTLTNEPLDKLVEERLEKEYKGKRALRKDAVVVREIIVQASPSVYEGLSFEEQRQKALKFTNDSLEWFRKEFGSKNVVGASIHMDETNPHTHFAIMPMTKDGRVSQKDFFKGPADLKRQHREYRKHMVELGWDFEEENKYSQTVEGVPLKQYKATAKKVEDKRANYDSMVEELKEDKDVRQEAINAVYRDIYDNMLCEALESLERREKRLNKNLDTVLKVRRDFMRQMADVARGYAPDTLVKQLDMAVEQDKFIGDAQKIRRIIDVSVRGASMKGKTEAFRKHSQQVAMQEYNERDEPELG